jgi:hypothetical protein
MDKADQALKVPMDLEYQPSWLSWVGATTSCLNALGVDCDLADVGGLSGYAFMMSVNDELCPSGPTMFDWGMLEWGIHILGRSTLSYASSDCHEGEYINDRTRAHCREAYELARREIAAGRPCVLWGAYVPEFAVVCGFDADGKYLLKSIQGHCGQPEPPLAYDELNAPGGPYLLAFPTPSAPRNAQLWGDQMAVGRAVQLLRQPRMFKNYGTGLKAYDTWIAALEAGKLSDFGNAYNAQCYASAKAYARDFLARVAQRNPAVAAPLGRAAEAYRDVAAAMKQVATLFPFPAGKQSEDSDKRGEAIVALRDAQAAETRAADALAEAMALEWKAEAAQTAQ